MNFKKISFTFFALYLFIGLRIYNDFGLNFDDGAQHQIGLINWDYIFNHDQSLLSSFDKYHGPAMEILLVGVEKVFGLTELRDILRAHHLVDFLVFYFSVVAFFFAARILLVNDKWALMACLMIVLSPRIFADSFYNSKDITFLSCMIFSLFMLLRLISRPGFINLLLLCLATALAIDIRILGIIFIPVTLIIVLKELILQAELRKRYFILLALYPFLLACFVILFWPVLWHDPLHNFAEAFAQMQHFPWGGDVLYAGSFISAFSLPWHYLPVWVLISTPLLFSLLWLAVWLPL